MTVIIPPRMSQTGLKQLRNHLEPRGNALRDSWQVTRRKLTGSPLGTKPGPQPGCNFDPGIPTLHPAVLHRVLMGDMVARIQVVNSTTSSTGWDVLLDGAVAVTLTPPTLPQVAAAAALLNAEPRRARPGLLGQRDWVAVYFAELFQLDPVQHALVLDLLDIATNIAMVPAFQVKLLADIPRPEDLVDLPETVIDCPWHPSWPSGHATAAYTISTVLAKLTGATAVPALLAHRISKGREAALVHTHLDSDAGKSLGEAIGNWLHTSATTQCATHQAWASLWEAARASLP